MINKKEHAEMDMHTPNSTMIVIPRGTPNLPPIHLDMTEIYNCENRVYEVRSVNPVTAVELRALFNSAANLSGKYIAWIEYEINMAKKQFDLAKATVILDKAPEEFKRLKDTGIKYNEDFRDALVARDRECQEASDKISHLTAIKAFIDSKLKTFIRSYYSCDSIAQARGGIAASPNFSGVLGQSAFGNLMGATHSDDSNSGQ